MTATVSPAARVSTGIAGLDEVLYGGLAPAGLFMISGPPGAGKTVLGNQMAFEHVRGGGKAIYITILSESHARLITQLESMTFLDRSIIGQSLFYYGGAGALANGGLDELLRLIQRTIREHRASLLVLEGLPTIAEVAGSRLATERFLTVLSAQAETLNCTIVGLTRPDAPWPSTIEAMADGVIGMETEMIQMRVLRTLQVSKRRGATYREGRHLYMITDQGIVVYPRTEGSLIGYQLHDEVPTSRKALGVAQLDAMIHDGVPTGSNTLVLGMPGSGKTLLGMHFLADGAEKGESGLYFGFYEPPPLIAAKGKRVGMPFDSYLESEVIQLYWQPPLEEHLDIIARRLMDAVALHQPQRVVIDGLTAMESTVIYPERLGHVVNALLLKLRAMNITTLITAESPLDMRDEITIARSEVTATVENLIFLRYIELNSQLYRLISVIKMQGSDYDSAIREFQITSEGIKVASGFDSAEAALKGIIPPGAGMSARDTAS